MVRRKHNRRLRQKKKTKFQKSFRENACSKNRNEESDAPDPHQRSPEAVLFESPHTDLCNEKLSPEIIPKRSKVRLRAKVCEDNAEVEDEVAMRKIELSNPSSLKCHESDPKCNYKHDTKFTSDFPHLENYLKRDIGGSIVDETFDSTDCYSLRSLFLKKEQSSDENVNDTLQNISQLATFCSNLESQLRNNVHIFTGDVPERVKSDEKNSERSSEERSQQEDCYKPEIMNDCYSLDKTLLINDDLICQKNKHVEKQSSPIITSCFKKSSSIADLQSELFDKFTLVKSSVSVEGNDELRDKADTSKKRRSDNDKRFDVERLGERLITNWHELRKLFSYLWRTTKKIRDQGTERGGSFLVKYKKFIRWHSYTSITTLSSLSSVFPFPASSPSPSDANSDENPSTYRSLLAKEDSRFWSESLNQETEYIDFGIQSGSCSRLPPPAKCCRTTLTCEDEKVGEQRQPATQAEIMDSFFKKGRKNEEHLFPLNLPSCEKTSHWNSYTSESTLVLSVNPSAVPDYDSYKNSRQQERYQDDAYKHDMSRSTATTQNSRNRSRRRNVPCAIITWMIALCVRLKKKLLHLLNSVYKKIQTINLFLTKKSLRTKNVSEEEQMNYLVTTLRFENEKTLCVLSEKMARLSADLVQMRTSIEISLNVLTTEMNVVREANKKMTENNATIMQELKKLHEIFEEMQSKCPQSVPLSSSSSSSRSPPPPPPPPLPCYSPLSLSSLTFPLKTQSSKSIISSPSLPLSSASVQSSIPFTVQPTTPDNSSKSINNRTPTMKNFMPSSNRPRITVEDLLKVTLRKAPQSINSITKDNRNCIPGPAVSLEMLRNVKLKSAKRRVGDQIGRSPRSRIMKNRTASNINLSPILTGSENNLERILRQVKLTRPRRLLESSSFHDHDFVKETQSFETPTRSQLQSGFD